MRSRASLQIALEAYEDALIRGLCHDGALEAALGAAHGVSREGLLRELGKAVKQSKKHLNIQIKRAYDPPNADDGLRVLVDRLWPRGIAKETAHIKAWFKELAPSAALRKWFGHDPARWEEFRRRYHHELDAQAKKIAELLDLADGHTLTLIYGAKDLQHNNAEALREYLLGGRRRLK